MPSKPFDLILFGSTGFTGKRAAKYLSDHAPSSLKWGIAARSNEKLTTIASQLHIDQSRCFIVDTLNNERVEELVQQTEIVITTVGPFSLYGEAIIAACAKFGTHYLDITGEVGFIKKMTDKYEESAQKSGAILIPFSGFDSVPADLTAFLLSKKFSNPEKLNIKAYYSINGGFNGGTIATMLHKFESGEYKMMDNPALLLNSKDTQNIHSPIRGRFFGYEEEIGRWSAPFIMGAINSKVVYKTAAELSKAGTPYAESIAYSEHFSLGKWYNPMPFIQISVILLCLTLLGPKKWFRTLLKKIMPAPGEGPTEEQIEKGFFKLMAIARDSENNEASLKMSYPGDPGNKSTVFFLCESALCLKEVLDSSSIKPGFHTPVTAFGDKLVERLSVRGLKVKLLK